MHPYLCCKKFSHFLSRPLLTALLLFPEHSLAEVNQWHSIVTPNICLLRTKIAIKNKRNIHHSVSLVIYYLDKTGINRGGGCMKAKYKQDNPSTLRNLNDQNGKYSRRLHYALLQSNHFT